MATGITYVRDAGGADLGLAEAVRRGLVLGPRMQVAIQMISQTGGHGDTDPVSDEPHLCACSIRSTAFAHIADGP